MGSRRNTLGLPWDWSDAYEWCIWAAAILVWALVGWGAMIHHHTNHYKELISTEHRQSHTPHQVNEITHFSTWEVQAILNGN